MGARGELTLRVGDRDVTMRFSAKALGETVERQLGKPVAEYLMQMSSNFGQSQTLSIGFRDLAIFLQAGMEVSRIDARKGGRPVTMDDAYSIIDELGFAEIAGPVIQAVSAAMTPPPASVASEEGQDPNA